MPKTHRLFIVCSLLLGFHVHANTTNQEHYHTNEEIIDFLQETVSEHPAFASIKKIGVSSEGRDLYVFVLKATQKSPINIYINAAHHGNEKSSTEATLGLIKHFILEHEDPDSQLPRSFNLYIQPVVNPDGYALNSRYDSQGIDPNRDYPYPGRNEFSSFRTPETTAIQNLMNTVDFQGSISLHAGIEGVLWPWCYSKDPNPHSHVFRHLAKATADAMDIPYYKQSSYDYDSRGEFIDYAYMKYQTFALTLEISSQLTPSSKKLKSIIDKTIRGTTAYLLALRSVLEKSQRT